MVQVAGAKRKLVNMVGYHCEQVGGPSPICVHLFKSERKGGLWALLTIDRPTRPLFSAFWQSGSIGLLFANLLVFRLIARSAVAKFVNYFLGSHSRRSTIASKENLSTCSYVLKHQSTYSRNIQNQVLQNVDLLALLHSPGKLSEGYTLNIISECGGENM